MQQGDILRHTQLSSGLMPSRSVKDDDSMSFGIDLLADLLKVQVHGPGVSLGNDPRGADAAGRADGAKEIGPAIALVPGLARPAAALGPDTRQRSLLTDARFILPPDLDGPVPFGLGDGGSDQVGKVFLCASWADVSWPGC